MHIDRQDMAQASAQPQGQPPSETALTPMKAGLAHLVFEPGRSWSMPAEPSRLVMALQQRALTRRPREERPPSRQDDEISLGAPAEQLTHLQDIQGTIPQTLAHENSKSLASDLTDLCFFGAPSLYAHWKYCKDTRPLQCL